MAQTPPASIFDHARRLPAGTAIPKPEAKAEFRIKGPGRRRGETAIIYTIPSHTGQEAR